MKMIAVRWGSHRSDSDGCRSRFAPPNAVAAFLVFARKFATVKRIGHHTHIYVVDT